MRIANPEAIRKGEKALADAIASNFDRDVIRKIFKRVHNLDVGEDIKCRNAVPEVHGDEVAYAMDFQVLVNLSVLLDRSGNFISISSSGVAGEATTRNETPITVSHEEPYVAETTSREPENGEIEDNDASPDEGSYESVLEEFASIKSESQETEF